MKGLDAEREIKGNGWKYVEFNLVRDILCDRSRRGCQEAKNFFATSQYWWWSDGREQGRNSVPFIFFFFIHFLPFYVCFSLFLSASSILDDLMKTKDVHENKSKMSRSHSGFLKNCFRRDSSESLGLFCLFVYWCNISIRILLDSHEGWPEIVFKKL